MASCFGSSAATAPRSDRRGFTLVEMLIVISIIGILAAIILPVLSRAREAGRRTSCISNMKQLGLAFQQYTNDYRFYPASGVYFTPDPEDPGVFGGFAYGWAPGNGHWVAGTPNSPLAKIDDPGVGDPTGNKADPEGGALFTYAKSAKVYYCPSNDSGEDKRLSYSMNCALTGISTVRVRQPTDIVLLVDEDKANDGFFFAAEDKAVSGTKGNSTDALSAAHNGVGVLLFADGHVKPYPFETFILDESPQGKANKWRETGSPRFHDRAFGPFGSNTRKTWPPKATRFPDYCDATKRDRTVAPPPAGP